MKRIKIAKHGPEFSRMVYGTWRLLDTNPSPQEINGRLHTCLDLGITTMHPSQIAIMLFAINVAIVNIAIVGADSRTDVTTSSPPTSIGANQRIVVWDGEKASKGAGWANSNSIEPQTVEAHSGKTALEFKFKGSGDEWLGMGWNWCAFQTGLFGTDITAMKNFSFWMKTKGKVADVQLNLLCNGEKFDMPEHHTEKVSALTYCPQLQDGKWHKVSIPLADFIQPKGFDPLHVGELQLFNAGEGEGSFFIDDIAFDNGNIA